MSIYDFLYEIFVLTLVVLLWILGICIAILPVVAAIVMSFLCGPIYMLLLITLLIMLPAGIAFILLAQVAYSYC